MRILVADDDENALDLLSECLQQAGHDVTVAHDGAEALRAFQEHRFSITVTDWEMPGTNGLELCRAIRDRKTPGYSYVILLTAHAGPDATIEGLAAGADDFVTKPFCPEELLMHIGVAERILALGTRDMAIFAMAKLAESRDPETGRHLDRVREYCRTLFESLDPEIKRAHDLRGDYAELLFLTCPLHDIGKIAIPDTVLLKPGRLSDREFDIMKQHTTLGAETLALAEREYPEAVFLQMARAIAETHHERYDGSGYPAGLVGENIPLCGRIMALADVYDALTSRRVYKAAFAHEVSRDIIVEESGSHFDPTIVDAFLSAEDRFIEIRTQLDADQVPGDTVARPHAA